MPQFHTQADAKRFFVERIVTQAHRDGVSLSDDERQMLLWSESEQDSVADSALAQRLPAAISDADYEAKIAGLLNRSFAHDVAADPGRKEAWSEAINVLRKGDHYILVMLDQSVGLKLKPWWRFW